MCNLRCLYCSHFSSAGDVESDLPAAEWTQFFEELNRCAVLDVTLCGGEPFLRKDLRELIESIVANRMRFSILTNGTCGISLARWRSSLLRRDAATMYRYRSTAPPRTFTTHAGVSVTLKKPSKAPDTSLTVGLNGLS